MEEYKGSVGEKVVYGVIFGAAMFLVGCLNLRFLYKLIIGGAVGGLLAYLRRPLGRCVVSVVKAKSKV